MNKQNVHVSRNGNELTATRILNAPQDLVYKVWSSPKHVGNWWGPNGFTLTTEYMDVRTGGEWKFTMHGPDGTDYPNKIFFTEVKEPELIAYRHVDDEDTEEISFEVEIRFEALGNQTRMHWKMVFQSPEELDLVEEKYGAIQGLVETTQRLVNLAESLQNDYCTYPDNKTLKLERILSATPETVWAFLTQSEKKGTWISRGDVEPKVGGKVTHIFAHKELSDEVEPNPEKYKDMPDEVTMYGKVLKWSPYSLLSYSWDEGEQGVSEVTFELEEIEPGKTRLTLTHTQIPDSMDFKVGVSAGWHTHLNIMRDVISGNPIKGFWGMHMPYETDYAKRLS